MSYDGEIEKWLRRVEHEHAMSDDELTAAITRAIDTHVATGEWIGRPAVVAQAQATKGFLIEIEVNMTGELPTGPTLRRCQV